MRENVRVIQQVYAAIQAKDAAMIRKLSDPMIVVRQSRELPWGGIYQGLEQAMSFFHLVQSSLASKVTLDQMLDAGDFVAATGRTEGFVRRSGQPFAVPLVHLWELRESRVVSLLVLLDNPAMSAALLAS